MAMDLMIGASSATALCGERVTLWPGAEPPFDPDSELSCPLCRAVVVTAEAA